MLFTGCLKSLAIMVILSYLATAALIAVGEKPVHDTNADSLSSSINFCEEDFFDSKYVAEPANAMSSLTTYCPLALLGLFGPASAEYSSKTASNKRFSLACISILAIGLGSFWLHSSLTASAQGGDELPMLWYVGIVAFMAFDCILDIREQKKKHQTNRWLIFFGIVSSVAATWTYVFNREDWIIFYAMFSIYCIVILIGVATLSFSDLNRYGDADSFRGNILLPLMSCTLWVYLVASTIWLSEMVYCHDVTIDKRWGDTIAPWLWNRAVHPAWHCTSALLAFLDVQIMMAVRGFQLGWGQPRLKWFGAPYVTFDKVAAD
jgi:dihydroceramidase